MSTDTKKKVAEPRGPTKEPLTTGHQAAVEAGAVRAAATRYQVVVLTGDVPGAGTDADVWLWVDGTAGRSQWRYLDNGSDNFERNQTDYFNFTLPDLGYLTSAWIYFRPSGPGPDWFLNTVVVNDKTFSHYNWLQDEGIYRLTPT